MLVKLKEPGGIFGTLFEVFGDNSQILTHMATVCIIIGIYYTIESLFRSQKISPKPDKSPQFAIMK